MCREAGVRCNAAMLGAARPPEELSALKSLLLSGQEPVKGETVNIALWLQTPARAERVRGFLPKYAVPGRGFAQRGFAVF